MTNRQPGCICELKENGEPVFKNYAACPVHKLTPQQYAEMLLDKFYNAIPDGDGKFIIHAKQSAIIAVDEILTLITPIYDAYGVKERFWEQVKEQISLM